MMIIKIRNNHTMTTFNWLLLTTLCLCTLITSTLGNDLGTSCQHDMDCTDFIKGSTCSNDGYCECAPYYVQLNRTTCLPSQLLGGDCHLAEQCSMKVANSSCLGGACRCVEGFLQFRKHTCLGPAHPGAVCYSNAHCQMFDKQTHCDFLIPNLFGRCQCTAPTKQFGGLCRNPDDESFEQWGTVKPAIVTPTLPSTVIYPLVIPQSTTNQPIQKDEFVESTNSEYYPPSFPSHPIPSIPDISETELNKTSTPTSIAVENVSEITSDNYPSEETDVDEIPEPEIVTIGVTTPVEIEDKISTEVPIENNINHKYEEDDVLDLDGQSEHYGHETPEDYPYKIDEDYNDNREQEQNFNSNEDNGSKKEQYPTGDSESIENEEISNNPSIVVSSSTAANIVSEEFEVVTSKPSLTLEPSETVTDKYSEEDSKEELNAVTQVPFNEIHDVNDQNKFNEEIEKIENSLEQATQIVSQDISDDKDSVGEDQNETVSNENENDTESENTKVDESASQAPEAPLESDENEQVSEELQTNNHFDSDHKNYEDNKKTEEIHNNQETQYKQETVLNNDTEFNKEQLEEETETTSSSLILEEPTHPLEESTNEDNVESIDSNEEFEDKYGEQNTEFSADSNGITNVGQIMPQYPENEEEETPFAGENEIVEKQESTETETVLSENTNNQLDKNDKQNSNEAEQQTVGLAPESNISEETEISSENQNQLDKEESAASEEIITTTLSTLKIDGAEESSLENVKEENLLEPNQGENKPLVEDNQQGTLESFEDVHSRPSSNDENHPVSEVVTNGPEETQTQNNNYEIQNSKEEDLELLAPTEKAPSISEESTSSESVPEYVSNDNQNNAQSEENSNENHVSASTTENGNDNTSVSEENVSNEQSEIVDKTQSEEETINENQETFSESNNSLLPENTNESENLSEPSLASHIETTQAPSKIDIEAKLPVDQAEQVSLITDEQLPEISGGNEPYDTVQFSEDNNSFENHESTIDPLDKIDGQQQLNTDSNEDSQVSEGNNQGSHKTDFVPENSEESNVINDKLETPTNGNSSNQSSNKLESEEIQDQFDKSQEVEISTEETTANENSNEEVKITTSQPKLESVETVSGDKVDEGENILESEEQVTDKQPLKDEIINNQDDHIENVASDEDLKVPELETAEKSTTVIPIEESSSEESVEDKIPEASEQNSVQLINELISTEKPASLLGNNEEIDSTTSAYDQSEQSGDDGPENFDNDQKFSPANSIVDILQTLIDEEEATEIPENSHENYENEKNTSPLRKEEEQIANMDEESQTPTLLEPVEESDSYATINDKNESINPTDIPEDQKLVTFYPDMETLASNDKTEDKKSDKINYNLPVKVSDKTKPSEKTPNDSLESDEIVTLSPNELPFDIPEDTKHPEPESDNLIVENLSQKDPNYYRPMTTQVPDIIQITTETMLGLANRPTIMEPSAPVTTTLQPLIEETTTTTTPAPKKNNERLSAIENRKRVDLGDGPVSLGLKCMSNKQCQLADPNTVCNSKRRCDCAHEGIQKVCSAERTGCSPGTFQCRSSGVCISWFFVCDGRPDCHDASDEECILNARTNQTCPTESFHCYKSGRCISRAALCDGRKQCPHGEDEIGCNSMKTGKCPPNTFRCKSGECLPEYEYCNAIISCRDGSDEPPHLCGSRSVPNIFLRLLTGTADNGFNNINRYCPHRCNNGRCRSTAIVCSGRDGCGDGTDEETCSVCRCPAAVFGEAKFRSNQPPMPLW